MINSDGSQSKINDHLGQLNCTFYFFSQNVLCFTYPIQIFYPFAAKEAKAVLIRYYNE